MSTTLHRKSLSLCFESISHLSGVNTKTPSLRIPPHIRTDRALPPDTTVPIPWPNLSKFLVNHPVLSSYLTLDPLKMPLDQVYQMYSTIVQSQDSDASRLMFSFTDDNLMEFRKAEAADPVQQPNAPARPNVGCSDSSPQEPAQPGSGTGATPPPLQNTNTALPPTPRTEALNSPSPVTLSSSPAPIHSTVPAHPNDIQPSPPTTMDPPHNDPSPPLSPIANAADHHTTPPSPVTKPPQQKPKAAPKRKLATAGLEGTVEGKSPGRKRQKESADSEASVQVERRASCRYSEHFPLEAISNTTLTGFTPTVISIQGSLFGNGMF